MFDLVYSLFIYLVSKSLYAISLFGPKAKLFVEGQIKIPEVLERIKIWKENNPKKEIVWFHCASLGEFEQGRPVLEVLKKLQPEKAILLTFFSPSGFEIRKNYPHADFISYLPIDTRGNAKRFIETVNPQIAVFVKYEFWPNMLEAIKANNTVLIGISVILRENQAFFKVWGGYFRKILKSFDHLFVQNTTTVELLQSIDYQRYTLAGDTRFDRVLDNKSQLKDILQISEFVAGKKVFVVGSAWAEDMEVLRPFVDLHPDIKFIIAPHELHENQIQDWATSFDALRFSQYSGKILPDAQVLIIDSIGLLSALYQYAHFAFVGGSFGKGLHNTLEAAVFGIPIFFGDKSYHKFEEARELISRGVAFPVSNFQAFREVFETLDNNKIATVKTASEQYVSSQAGATDIIVKFLAKY